MYINSIGQTLYETLTTLLRGDSRAAGNSTFAIDGVSCSADSLVVAESFVLRIKFSGKNPAHRKSAKRYGHGRATAQADTTDTKKDHAHPPPQII